MTAKSKEQRYAETGMTATQVDQLIIRMKAQGYGLKEIGAAVGLTPSGIHRAIARLARASSIDANPVRPNVIGMAIPSPVARQGGRHLPSTIVDPLRISGAT